MVTISGETRKLDALQAHSRKVRDIDPRAAPGVNIKSDKAFPPATNRQVWQELFAFKSHLEANFLTLEDMIFCGTAGRVYVLIRACARQ